MMQLLCSDQLEVRIKPSGAEICSVKNSNGVEFIWQADPSIWARHAPVLFPIVGKLKNNLFNYEGKAYTLPQHGFARDRIFNLVHSEKNQYTFQFISDEESKKHFPFDFTLEIRYTLIGNTIDVNYMVHNTSETEMQFSIGAHPGFNCPLLPNEKFEDYYLEFERSEITLTSLQDGLLSLTKRNAVLKERKLFLNKNLFESDALILENSQVNKIILCSTKSEHRVIMECKDWPYFGIWTKKDCDKFICLEPWYGITDSVDSEQQLKNKKGILSLSPSEKFNCAYQLSFI